MPARCLPERPRFRSRAEKVAFHALASKLRDVDVLLANVRFTGLDGDWEVDLVVGMPDAGFAAIEVKGGNVWRADGTWWQQTPKGRRAIDLEDQATSGKYLLRRYLERNPHWSHGKPRMIHMVILPDTTLGPEDPSPGLPRQWIIDKDQLPDAAGRIFDLLTGPLKNEPQRMPGVDAVDDAAEILGGRGDRQAELAGMLAVRGDHVDRLTADQYTVLDLARRIPRIEVIGGPGTGKTWLAIEQAKRWAADGRRVALVCYSRGLSTWIARRVAAWPKALRRNVRVHTYHALGVEWGLEIRDGQGQEYWEQTLPAQMTDLARALPDERRFDALIVDEAQDCPDAGGPPCSPHCATRRSPGSPSSPTSSSGSSTVTSAPTLGWYRSRSMRTCATAARSEPCSPRWPPTPPLSSAARAPRCGSSSAAPAEAMDTADDAALELLDEGWDAEDVAVLTTHHRHPEQANRVALDGRDGYWDSFWDGTDMFFSTVAAFKGLERPAIVLAVDGFRDPVTARDTLYVGTVTGPRPARRVRGPRRDPRGRR